jgi:hypothetical protein
MPVFTCPHCGWQAPNVPAEYSGRKVRCKQCQGVFQLPVFEADPSPRPRPQPQLAPPAQHAGADYAPAAPAATPQFAGYAVPPPQHAPINISVVEQKANPVAVAAFVVGLICVFLFWVPLLGFILSAVGVITAIVGIIFATRGHRGMTFSIIGGVLSLVAISINTLMMVQATKRVLDVVAENRTTPEEKASAAVPLGVPARVGNVEYTVAAVHRGRAKVKSFSGQFDSDETYVHVEVKIRNVTENKKINYRGAGSETFIGSSTRLTDDAGNDYRRVHFGFGNEVVGQVESESIHPDDEVTDVWLFEHYVRTAKTLFFTVKGTSLGAEGETTFAVPVSDVKIVN